MKPTFFLLLVCSLALAACGKAEKTNSPFDGMTFHDSPVLSPQDLAKRCNSLRGRVYENNTKCEYIAERNVYSDKDLDTLNKSVGITQIDLGSVPAGTLVWGQVKGGQAVRFYLNQNSFASMASDGANTGNLNRTLVPGAGKLSLVLLPANNYTALNYYVAECFSTTQTQSTPCTP
jgi:hypothetical protein